MTWYTLLFIIIYLPVTAKALDWASMRYQLSEKRESLIQALRVVLYVSVVCSALNVGVLWSMSLTATFAVLSATLRYRSVAYNKA